MFLSCSTQKSATMRLFVPHLVFMLLFYRSAASVQPYSCTESSMQRCLGNVSSVQELQFPRYTADELKKHCRVFKEASKTCLLEVHQNCTGGSDSIVVAAVTDMFDYLCGEGFDVYIKSTDCIANEFKKPKMIKCLETFNDQNTLLRTSSGSSQLKRLCRNINTFVGCHVDVIKRRCSKEAGNLVVQMAKKTFSTVFRQTNSNCPINEAVRVAVSLTSLLIVSVVWRVVCLGENI